jgi:Zn-dependent protease
VATDDAARGCVYDRAMGFDYGSAAIQVAILLFALSFHEMAHAWAANKLGDSTAREQGRLTMNPISHIDPFMTVIFPAILILLQSPVIFGAAKPVPVDTRNLKHPKRDHMWIAAAGPISNIILAAITIAIINLAWQPLQVGVAMGEAWAPPLLYFLQMNMLINLVLAAFNMIPLYPLDGSWVLSRFLSGGVARAYASLRPYGFFILIVLMYTGTLWRFINPVIGVAAYFLP